MERETCTGTRKGKECAAPLFKCSHCGSVGCEKSACDNRQFTPIERCKDCGRAYERLKQYKPSAAPIDDAGSAVVGRPIALPNIELMFGAVLGLAVLAAAIAGIMGVFGTPRPGGGAGAAAPTIEARLPAATPTAFTDICQCYRKGMSLAGTGASVLSTDYRVGFVQCRASFGTEGGDAWTAGWRARSEGKMVGAGCRSWLKGVGQ